MIKVQLVHHIHELDIFFTLVLAIVVPGGSVDADQTALFRYCQRRALVFNHFKALL
jgi:hypothetical protein